MREQVQKNWIQNQINDFASIVDTLTKNNQKEDEKLIMYYKGIVRALTDTLSMMNV